MFKIGLHWTVNEKAEEERLGFWPEKANEPENISTHAIEIFCDVGNGILS